MADPPAERTISGFIGPPISTALGALATWLAAGSTGALAPALASLLAALGGICGLAFTLTYRHYFGVLGGANKRRGTLERQDFDALRESLTRGNLAV
jgi:hypothetical protein